MSNSENIHFERAFTYSAKDITYNENEGKVTVGGKTYQIVITRQGETKEAKSLSNDEKKDLVQTIKNLFDKTNFQFENLEGIEVNSIGIFGKEGFKDKFTYKKEAYSKQYASIKKLFEKVHIKTSTIKTPDSKKLFSENLKSYLASEPKTIAAKTVTAPNGVPSSDSNAITMFGKHEKKQIGDAKGYTDDYSFLSNFHQEPFEVPYETDPINPKSEVDENAQAKTSTAHSVEAYYQAEKYKALAPKFSKKTYKKILTEKDPLEAKKLTRKALKEVKDQSKWGDKEAQAALRTGLIHKFIKKPLSGKPQLSEAGRNLIKTGNSTLIEGNERKDQRWGMVYKDGSYTGQNLLGKALMDIRKLLIESGFELREE